MKRKDLARRAASAAMAACMMFTLSAPALAESTDALMQLSMTRRSAVSVLDAENGGPDLSDPLLKLDLANGSIEVYIENGKQYAKQGESERQCDKLVVTSNGTQTDNTLTIKGGSVAAKVTLSNVNIDVSTQNKTAALSVSGDVELILDGVNVLKSGYQRAGLQKNDDGVLTIDGTGSLEADGGNYGAGIGAGHDENGRNARNIVINGGTINAYGGDHGAGIGGCDSNNGSERGIGDNITINGGTINAYGGDQASGIGGGGSVGSDNAGARGVNITIAGGAVYAEAGYNAAAIGGGGNALGYDIAITGGNVTVKKKGGKWIGGREQGNSKEIDFSGTAATITYLNEDGSVYKKIATVDYGITVTHGKKAIPVTSANCDNILGNSSDSTLRYDPDAKKLTSNGTIYGLLSINAPDVDVELNGENFALQDSGLYGSLTIENAKNVTVFSQKYAAVQKDVNVTCTGKLTVITNDNSWAAIGRNLTVHSAASVQIESEGDSAVGGDVKIECACPATFFKNNQNGGIAQSITYAGDYVYYTSDAADAEAVDPNVTSIPAETAKYVRIAPKMRYNINTAEDATIKLQGKSTELKTAFAGEEVTVTAADRENAEFTDWTAEGITLTDKQNPTVTFTMPDKSVTLTPNYKQYYTITSNDAAVIIKVDDVAADKALKGQTIKALAPNKDGWEFEKWEATGVDLGKQVNNNWITFKMPESNVTLNPQYAKLHAITVLKGIATLAKAKEGTEVTVKADDRPGYVFDRWVVNKGDVELTDAKSKTTTFTVKGGDVEVEAKYKELHGISIEGGSFTVNGGTAATAKRGDAIVATADSAPAGQKFSHWEVTGVDGLTKEQLENVPLEFTMPRGEVTLKAVFKTLHKIGVKFSTADKETAIEGETVKITAESRPGYVFDRWEVNNGDVAVANKNAEETTFVMPDVPVTAVAKYKKLLGIKVNSGKAYVEDAVTDAALKGKLVVIKAEKIEGKRFDQWKIVSGDVILDDLHASETRFTMPETAVEITAGYNDLHAITVNNGTADVEEAVIGDTVKIKAESRPGYVFDRWEVSYGDVVVDDKNAEETTFTMPDSMVVLTARYKALQSITLEKGKAYAGGEEITTAKKGTEVAIKAENLDGKVFDHWEIVSGNVTLKDANKAETSFTMPAEPISLKAVYNTIHSIDTTFCTADPASAIKGTEITVTADSREGYKFDGWEVSDGVELYDEDGLTAKFTMPDNDVTIKAKYKQYHSIEVSKGVATDAEGNPISSAVEGTEIWIEIDRAQRNPDEFEFKHWESGPEDLEIADRKAERTYFTMPDEAVTVEAKFLHLREITVHDGTTYVEGEESGIAKDGQTVTVKADEIPGLKFDHWTVDSANVTLTTVDEATGEATFEMVNEPVELTAHYKAMVTVFSDPAKFSEDTGEESVTEWADVGEMANITAEIDEAIFPGMVFDYWEIVTPADLKTENIEGQTITFEVPKSEVKLVAHWKSDALSPIPDPDAPLDPDFDVDDGSGAAGAIVAGAALGGAAVWGGYEITTRVILNDLLPEGAAIPTNRGQLAMLIWTEKDKPEPAAQPAFADVADSELAKAAQWCVEQGLLDAKDGKFDPNGWMPKFKTIEVWKKAFPKQ